MENEQRFYVYKWTRKDTNSIFYIGKGKGKRAFERKNNRNRYFKNIISSTDCCVEILYEDLTEQEAFLKEVDLIKLYKGQGQCEANLTNGGEGTSGWKPSAQTIENMKKAQKGKIISPEQKAKLRKAKLGTKASEETKEKMSKSLKGKLVYTEEMRELKRNSIDHSVVHSETARAKMAAAKVGKRPKNYGKPLFEETKRKLSEINRGNTSRAKEVIDTATGVVYRSAKEAASVFNLNPNTLRSYLTGVKTNKTTLKYVG